ncbi:MAG: YbeD family protein [Granulosicoccaceae bacterium]
MSEQSPEELITFPCDFEVKAMGKASEDFEALVLAIVRKLVPELGDKARRTAPSKSGTYISVTVGFEAQSKEQLDAVYQALVDEPRVLYAL